MILKWLQRTYNCEVLTFSADLGQGDAASLVHVGAYPGLGAAPREIAAMGREQAGPFWEIYGDWSEDPAKLETTIGYLLADSRG